MRINIFQILIITFLAVGCNTAEKTYSTNFLDRPLLSEPVDIKALDGLWEMSFPQLTPALHNNDGKPCNQIYADRSYVKVVNGNALTWHYAGKGYTAPIDGNGIFTFSRPSGYAYFFPNTKKRMPKPIIVTIKARITEEGTGVGSIVYFDENEQYALCGGALEFIKTNHS